VHDWEVEVVSDFFKLFFQRVRQGGKDKMSWIQLFGVDLQKRHVIVVDWCCMCKKSEEPIDHFLLHYEVARKLFRLFGVVWVMPQRVRDLLVSWRGQLG
jgi:hypothetical protein